MHSMPRSSADILATATRAPCVVKQPRKPYKRRTPNPLASHPSFTKFSQREPVAPDVDSTPRPVSELAVTMTENIYKNSAPRTYYVPPVNFKFVPQFASEGVSETPECSGQDQVGSTSCTIPEPLELDEEPSLHSEPAELGREPNESVEEVLTVLHKNDLNPFDLILELLDESRPEYDSYRKELYNTENDQLKQILDRVSSNAAGRNKLTQILHDSEQSTAPLLEHSNGL